MRCHPNDRPGLERVLEGAYDVPGLSFERPPVILDIGANVGAATLWALGRFPGCSVVAFEPNLESANSFGENLTLASPFEAQRVRLLRSAVVGLELGVRKLYAGKDGPGQASLYRLGEQRDDFVLVPTFAARNLPPADFLKVDTEGCEVEILLQYAPIGGVAAIALEWHRARDRFFLRDWLEEQGFELLREEVHSTTRGDQIWKRRPDDAR